MIKSSLTFFLLSLSLAGSSQQLSANLFFRTPQLINYNFQNTEWTYSHAISAGVGMNCQAMFLEAATFINDRNISGYYTFFGTNLLRKKLDESWQFSVNWFGEVTYIPGPSPEQTSTWLKTTGLCFLVHQQRDWVIIGFPLCVGLASDGQSISWNNRVMINLSFPLKS